MPLHACVVGGGVGWGGGVHQQLMFSCGSATANQLLHFKEVGQSQHLVHFPLLNASLPGKTLPGNAAFILQFVCCGHAEVEG